jgi:hypothetical protein
MTIISDSLACPCGPGATRQSARSRRRLRPSGNAPSRKTKLPRQEEAKKGSRKSCGTRADSLFDCSKRAFCNSRLQQGDPSFACRNQAAQTKGRNRHDHQHIDHNRRRQSQHRSSRGLRRDHAYHAARQRRFRHYRPALHHSLCRPFRPQGRQRRQRSLAQTGLRADAPAFEIRRLLHQLHGWNKADLFIDAWRSAGFRIVGHVVFRKRYPSSTRFLQYQHEQAYVLAKGDSPRRTRSRTCWNFPTPATSCTRHRSQSPPSGR